MNIFHRIFDSISVFSLLREMHFHQTSKTERTPDKIYWGKNKNKYELSEK